MLLADLEAAQNAAADGPTLATVDSAVLSPSGRRLQDKTRWSVSDRLRVARHACCCALHGSYIDITRGAVWQLGAVCTQQTKALMGLGWGQSVLFTLMHTHCTQIINVTYSILLQ